MYVITFGPWYIYRNFSVKLNEGYERLSLRANFFTDNDGCEMNAFS